MSPVLCFFFLLLLPLLGLIIFYYSPLSFIIWSLYTLHYSFNYNPRDYHTHPLEHFNLIWKASTLHVCYPCDIFYFSMHLSVVLPEDFTGKICFQAYPRKVVARPWLLAGYWLETISSARRPFCGLLSRAAGFFQCERPWKERVKNVQDGRCYNLILEVICYHFAAFYWSHRAIL